jgi:hypothetical protein
MIKEYFLCYDIVKEGEALVGDAEAELVDYILDCDSYNNEVLDILKANINERVAFCLRIDDYIGRYKIGEGE